MRTIKFRGKQIANGDWIFGDLFHEIALTPSRKIKSELNGFLAIQTETLDGIKSYSVDPETVGQFTGLYDKNDREIYEGDILKVHYYGKSKVFGVVKFNYCRFYIDDDEIEYRLDPKTSMSDMFGREYEWEVVGNIYDNTELLEGGA